MNSTGGAINIGNNDDAQSINVGTGSSARTITLGNAASTAVNTNAQAITLTSVDALTLTDGTANLALGGTGATSINGASTFGLNASSTISMNSTGGAINIGEDTNTGAINVGTGSSARTITVGNAASTALNANAKAINLTSVDALTLTDGTASLALGGTGATTLVGATTVDLGATGAISLNSSGGAINIGNNDDAQSINVGTGSSARTIKLGKATDVTTKVELNAITVDINAGTEGIKLDAGGASNFTTSSGALTLNGASGVAIQGALTANSTANISSTLTLSKTSGNGLDVTANALINGNLEVTGDTTLTGDVTFGQGFSVNNKDITINGLTAGKGNNNVLTNTAFGVDALSLSSTTANSNTAIGYKTLEYNTSGDNNTAVGYHAGKSISLQSTSGNTFIGCDTTANIAASNSTAIGYQAVITASNQIMLGTASETVAIPGSLSIAGTTVTATAAELNTYILNVALDNISEASSCFVVVPKAGTISKISSIIDGTIGTADAIITANVNGGVNNISAQITIANNSAATTIDTCTPTDYNTVNAGQYIKLTTNGGSTNAVKAVFTIEITY